jgi:hypothetical protein
VGAALAGPELDMVGAVEVSGAFEVLFDRE